MGSLLTVVLTAIGAPSPDDDPATFLRRRITDQENRASQGIRSAVASRDNESKTFTEDRPSDLGAPSSDWEGPSDTRPTTAAGSGFFSPDSAINFARDFAVENAPSELRDQVSETARTFETPLRRDEPSSSETSNTIDRAVTEDPTRGVSRTVETGKIERAERPIYTRNRATQGISSRPTQDAASPSRLVDFATASQATQGIGGSAVPTVARATQGIGAWYNKGRNVRIPNESTAGWGELWRDNQAQGGMSKQNWQQGKKPGFFGRPDRSVIGVDIPESIKNRKFVTVPAAEGGPGSAPTPLVRQVGERILGPIATGASIFAQGQEGSALDQTVRTAAENQIPWLPSSDARQNEGDIGRRAGEFIARQAGNVRDWFVDKMGNVRRGVTKDESGQATGFGTGAPDPWSMENLESKGFVGDGTLIASGSRDAFANSNVDEWSRRLLQGGSFPTEKELNERLQYDPYGGSGKGRGMGDRGDASSDGDTLVASAGGVTPNIKSDETPTPSSAVGTYGTYKGVSLSPENKSWIDPDTDEIIYHDAGAGDYYGSRQDTKGSAEKEFLDNYIKDPEGDNVDDYQDQTAGVGSDLDQRFADYERKLREAHERAAQLDPENVQAGGPLWVDRNNARREWEAAGGPKWGQPWRISDAEQSAYDKAKAASESDDLPSMDQLQSGEGYIKNADTGEVTKVGGSKPGGVNTGATTDLNETGEAKTKFGTSSSDSAIAASDKAVADAEAAWTTASNNQKNYLGGRTAGTQEEFNEYMKLQALSDAASKRLDAAYAQQAEAMKNYSPT